MWSDDRKVSETTAKNWGQQRKSIRDNNKELGMTAKRQWPSIEIHMENGSGVQQCIQPRQTDDESSLLELAVVQDKGSDDDKT